MSKLYYISKENHTKEKLEELLKKNKQIRFVSLMGIDLGGNATDEKIPIELFLKNIDAFLEFGIQTDGSSVELHEIATLNNAKVDLVPDLNVNWYIDYNYELLDEDSKSPVGTLKIPAFLIHNNKKICSRGILEKSIKNAQRTIIEILKENPYLIENTEVDSVDDIESIVLTAATELEFWVNTPEDQADLEKLYVSQSLKEQYWKKTQGSIRSALEQTLINLQNMGVEPEMGHKEVGGISSSISIDGKTNHAMEQLEIDWKYSNPLQSSDNEIIIRDIVEETFKDFGLEVTYKAKPLDKVAGSGEHTHIGIGAKLKDGKIKNLYAPKDMEKDFMSEIGYGALMGILKNYEILNPFITFSNDAFNRLVPDFEAPVCIVTSLGSSYEVTSRNRSVLIGLIRDIYNPISTRFELRSPNPLSNTYIVLAGCYQAMLDGIKAVAENKLNSKELEKEISKQVGEEGIYLEKDRQYRDEKDVFEYYSEIERNQKFGVSPATVYENMLNLEKYEAKLEVLKDGGVFTNEIINSFKVGALDRWKKELMKRIIQDNIDIIRSCKKLHQINDIADLDEVKWNEINNIKYYLMKDTLTRKSVFSEIVDALEKNEYDRASNLQLEMKKMMEKLQITYIQYKKNLY